MRVRPIWIAPLTMGAALAVAAALPFEPFQAATASAGKVAAQTNPALKKRVTKRFVNANLSDVLAWLSLEQLSFVADMGSFPDKKVTFNFVNQPMEDVLTAIADTFGGRWEQRGDIWTLKAGSSFASRSTGVFSGATTQIPRTFEFKPSISATASGARNLDLAVTPKFSGTTINVRPLIAKSIVGAQKEEAKKLTPEQQKEIEKAVAQAKEELQKALQEIKKLKGQPGSPERAQLEEMHKQLSDILGKLIPKIMESFPKGLTGFKEGQAFAIDPKVWANMKLDEKAMAEHMKGFEKMKLDDKAMAEHMKVFDKAFAGKIDAKVLEKLKLTEKEHGEQMKLFEKTWKGQHFDTKVFEKMDEKGMAEKMKALEKTFTKENFPFMKLESEGVFHFGGQNLSALLDSLTDEQSAKMKKQGYLSPEDLTAKQKSLLGKLPAGKWEITFVRDGKKITLKGGK